MNKVTGKHKNFFSQRNVLLALMKISSIETAGCHILFSFLMVKVVLRRELLLSKNHSILVKNCFTI